MDPLDQGQARLQYLEQAAAVADQRLEQLRALRKRNEGALVALLALEGQLEKHRLTLVEPGEEVAPERQDLVDGQISGVQDSITFLRVAKRAEESQGFILYGQETECDAHRRQLATQARDSAQRLSQLLQQLEEGVPREDLGRPAAAAQMRQELELRRAKAASTKAETKKADATGKKAANHQLRRSRALAPEG